MSHTYRTDSTALLGAPKQLFDEMSEKYDGKESEEMTLRVGGIFPSIIRPLAKFGKRDAGKPDEQYRLSLLYAPADMTEWGGISRLELLPGMPRTREEYLNDGNVFRLKPLLTLYAGKKTSATPRGGRFYLERSAKLGDVFDGFSYYSYEQFAPLVSEMFLRFGELTSGFAFYIDEKKTELT